MADTGQLKINAPSLLTGAIAVFLIHTLAAEASELSKIG